MKNWFFCSLVLVSLPAYGFSSDSAPPEAFENSFEGLLIVLNELRSLELERSLTLQRQEERLRALKASLRSATARSFSLETTSEDFRLSWEASEASLSRVQELLTTSATHLSQATTKLAEQQASLRQLQGSLRRSQLAVIWSSVLGPVIGAGIVLLIWQPWN